jgi:hypothetical protein
VATAGPAGGACACKLRYRPACDGAGERSCGCDAGTCELQALRQQRGWLCVGVRVARKLMLPLVASRAQVKGLKEAAAA